MTPDTAQTDKTGPETRAQADPAYEDAEVSECRAGSQKTDIFQADARRIFEAANDRPLMPWSWMLNTCQTTHCLNPDHLITHAPLKINYPPGVCVYCGMPSGTRDHLIPRGLSGEARRVLVATVPACGDCNNRINDHPSPSVAVRRKVAHDSIRRAKRKLLAAPDWTEEQMREFGPTLRTFIRTKAREKQAIMCRLEWPYDPYYDLRAFQLSGIDDPVAIGLCDDPHGASPIERAS